MSSKEEYDLENVASGSAKDLRRALVSDALIDEVIAQAGDQGITLTGDGGLLPELIKAVLERGLAVELDDHLGFVKGDPAGAWVTELAKRVHAQDAGHPGRPGPVGRAWGPSGFIRPSAGP